MRRDYFPGAPNRRREGVSPEAHTEIYLPPWYLTTAMDVKLWRSLPRVANEVHWPVRWESRSSSPSTNRGASRSIAASSATCSNCGTQCVCDANSWLHARRVATVGARRSLARRKSALRGPLETTDHTSRKSLSRRPRNPAERSHGAPCCSGWNPRMGKDRVPRSVELATP